MKNKKLLIFITLIGLLSLSSCTFTDQLTTDLHQRSTAIIALTQAVETLSAEQAQSQTQQTEMTQAVEYYENEYSKVQATHEVVANRAQELQALLFGESEPNLFYTNFEATNLFQEYEDPEGDWEASFANGGVELDMHLEDINFFYHPDKALPTNVYTKVDVQKIEGDEEAAAGLVCHYDRDTDTGIFFEVSFDGYYIILEFIDGEIEIIEPYTLTDQIKQNDLTSIASVCDQNHYEFYINDQLIYQYNSTQALEGNTLFYSYTNNSPETIMFYDNYLVYNLDQ